MGCIRILVPCYTVTAAHHPGRFPAGYVAHSLYLPTQSSCPSPRQTGWPIRSHGQQCNLQFVSDKTVHHQNHLDTRTQFVDSKPATPTAFDPHRRQPLPAAIYAAPPRAFYLMNSLPQNKITNT
jgi:hypothetical protein